MPRTSTLAALTAVTRNGEIDKSPKMETPIFLLSLRGYEVAEAIPKTRLLRPHFPPGLRPVGSETFGLAMTGEVSEK